MPAVNWIMTANTIDRMPQAFLDRCTLVELPEPSVSQLAAEGRELLGAAMPDADVKGASHVLARQLSTANNHGKRHCASKQRRLFKWAPPPPCLTMPLPQSCQEQNRPHAHRHVLLLTKRLQT